MNKDMFKVGQKVRLIGREKLDFSPYGGINDDMIELLGEEVTIANLCSSYFEIEEDNEMWVWDFNLIEEKASPKVYLITDFDYEGEEFNSEDYILPCGYNLIKVIENGNTVICFVESEETESIIKTVSQCQDGDTFDLHKGVEICMYKTLRKIANKNLKRF